MLKDVATGAVVLSVVAVFSVQFLSSSSDRQKTQPAIETAAASPVNAVVKSAKPAQPAATGNSVTLQSDGRGHYAAQLAMDGIEFEAMVDTGASVVALPQSVAERLGLFPGPEQFTQRVSTANGELAVAPVRLSSITLGNIRLNDVEAVVIPDGKLEKTLLGMSFLKRLKRFEIRDGKLILSN